MKSVFVLFVALFIGLSSGCTALTPQQASSVQGAASLIPATSEVLKPMAVDLAATGNVKTAASVSKVTTILDKVTPIATTVATSATQPGATPITIILSGAETGAGIAASGGFGPQVAAYGMLGLSIIGIARMIQAQIHNKSQVSATTTPSTQPKA